MTVAQPYPLNVGGAGNGESRRPLTARAERLLEIVRGASAIRLVDAKRELEAGWSATYRAVAELERVSLVRTERRGKAALILSAEQQGGVESSARRGVALRSRKARAIFDMVRSAPGVGIQQIIRTLDMQPRIVYYHVRLQVEAGLLGTKRSGRYAALWVMEDAGPGGKAASPPVCIGSPARNVA